MSDKNQRIVYVANMTNFFSRELFMYSLGDIRFKKPISLKKVAYSTAFLILWAIPLVLIFGIRINPFYIALLVIPPIVLGNFAAKPVWGGRGLIDFLKTISNFISEPKGWTDLNSTNKLDKETLYVESEIWLSRRRELQLLADLREEKVKLSEVTTFKEIPEVDEKEKGSAS